MSTAVIQDLGYFIGETETVRIPVNNDVGEALDVTSMSVEVGIKYRSDTPTIYDETHASVTRGVGFIDWAVQTDQGAALYGWWVRITDDGSGGNRVIMRGALTLQEP